jgi:hypothetical protein
MSLSPSCSQSNLFRGCDVTSPTQRARSTWLRFGGQVQNLFCIRGNESVMSLKCGEFFDWVSDFQLLKSSPPWSYFITEVQFSTTTHVISKQNCSARIRPWFLTHLGLLYIFYVQIHELHGLGPNVRILKETKFHTHIQQQTYNFIATEATGWTAEESGFDFQ